MFVWCFVSCKTVITLFLSLLRSVCSAQSVSQYNDLIRLFIIQCIFFFFIILPRDNILLAETESTAVFTKMSSHIVSSQSDLFDVSVLNLIQMEKKHRSEIKKEKKKK